MRKYFCLLLTAFCLLLTNFVIAQVREPAVSGPFYPASKTELSSRVDEFLKNVPSSKIEGELIGLIVPHAGYDYSGQVAAYGFKEVIGKNFDTVILIGGSHQAGIDEIAVYNRGSFKTPLGLVKIDENLADRLIKSHRKIVPDLRLHEGEHSLEVQIPFLQKVLKDFKIVPVIIGRQTLENCRILEGALFAAIKGKKVLIIASSDFSHYYPYEQAKWMDTLALEAIRNNDLPKFVERLSKGESEACGYGAIITLMLLAPDLGGNKIEVLKYANSGDVTGDKSRVVGYAAVGFYRKEELKMELNRSQQKELLKIARSTLEEYLKAGREPEISTADPLLKESRGVFVTLTKFGKLKGCIGYIQAVKPLYQAVSEMAIEAAVHDIRFEPVKYEELKNIKIEITVLSPLEEMRDKDPKKIIIGKHGLYIRKGFDSGILLPQVAPEWGWNAEQFLENTCYKAGLSADAWKDKEAIVYTFTAQIFHEE